MARRVIPARERWQKAAVVIALTAAVVAGVCWLTGVTLDSQPDRLLIPGAIALSGLVLATWLLLHRHESATTREGQAAIRERIDDDRSGAGWTARIGYNAKRAIFGLIVLAGLLVALAGVGILGYQAYLYLKFGEWRSISVFGALAPFVPWLANPQSWPGLYRIVHQALSLLPVSLSLVVLGWIIAGFAAGQRAAIRRRGH